MNAETRAKELLAAIVERGTGGWRFAAEVEEALPLITDAIRQAENDKLEEAARAAEKAFGGKAHTYASENADIYRAQDAACERIAGHIRALKKD